MSTRQCPKCDNIVKFSFFQFSFTKLTCENCKTKLKAKPKSLSKRYIFSIFLLVVTTLLFVSSPVFGQKKFIPFGSTWKYLDDGSDQKTAWYELSFDDKEWKSGKAKLGYGDEGEVTIVSYGKNSLNKHITTYFRKKIDILNPRQYLGFILKLRYDDGGVVYLNGNEIFRANMQEGEVYFRTLARVGSGEDETFISKEKFRDGENIIAVEIHQSSPFSSDIEFDFELSEAVKLPDFTRKPPYLIYNGNNTEMELHWQFSASVPCRLIWGADLTYSSGKTQTHEYGTEHQHKYNFRNLEPGKKYYYQVSFNNEVFRGSFLSAPDPDAKKINFLVLGDTRTYPEIHDKVAEAIIEAYTTDKSYQTILFCVGDLVGNGNSESNWDKQMFSQEFKNILELHANVPFQGVIGNHEGSGKLFKKYFPYPYEAERYWSFDYGPAHFVVVDQYIRTFDGRKKQVLWLENDLASTKKPWKFIFLHEPGWSAGGHRNHIGVQNQIQPLCEKYGVSIVFAGHNHYYARANVNGIQHVTTGGGGAPFHNSEDGHPYILTHQKVHHFCKIGINDKELYFSVVNAKGEVFDQFKLSRKKQHNAR